MLDGGIGHELKSRGVATLCEQLGFHDLFAAGSIANREKPNIVEDVHVAYIEAHADIITANNFGCTQHALGKVGEAGNACNLIRDACHIAQKARIRAGVPGVKIAGKLVPCTCGLLVLCTQLSSLFLMVGSVDNICGHSSMQECYHH